MKLAPLVIALLIANIIGALFGFWIYWEQMSQTPLLLLVFVPDCPLYVLLFVLRYFKTSKLFDFVVSVGLVKYGIWTLFVLLYFRNIYFLPMFFMFSALLFVLHIGMALEGILLSLRIGIKEIAVALAWFLLNDYADYVLRVYPWIPGKLGVIPQFTLLMTFLSILLVISIPQKSKLLVAVRKILLENRN